MSLVNVRTYFAGLAEGLGYRKHFDGFAVDNIPSSKFNQTYHVSAFNFTGSPQNQLTVDLNVPVTVRLYFQAYRDVDAGIEAATAGGEVYLDAALSASNRLTQEDGFKNVILDSIVIEPYSGSNDNSVVCRMEFRVLYFKGIC